MTFSCGLRVFVDYVAVAFLLLLILFVKPDILISMY